MEASCADILSLLVDRKSDLRQSFNRIGRELELDPFSFKKSLVLPLQTGIGISEDLDKIICTERLDSSTRIGKRPCNSGIRSEGFAR